MEKADGSVGTWQMPGRMLGKNYSGGKLRVPFKLLQAQFFAKTKTLVRWKLSDSSTSIFVNDQFVPQPKLNAASRTFYGKFDTNRGEWSPETRDQGKRPRTAWCWGRGGAGYTCGKSASCSAASASCPNPSAGARTADGGDRAGGGVDRGREQYHGRSFPHYETR
ncbi:hypothetical protein Ciccas_005507 [Cichlidogyrus casuarinus]|uniref:Uncharacterized protein n=1 Tax=Cichlidogyrus casuarinus TaxID=1844966 RepID=A0ABD2QAS9_9PLAT